MSRAIGTVHRHAKSKKVLELAKGYRGRNSTSYRIALERVEKGLQYAYRDRRVKKRNFRSLWIQRINAGARQHGLTYSQFMNGVKQAGVELDRKILADLAVKEPGAFKALVDQAQDALNAGDEFVAGVMYGDRDRRRMPGRCGRARAVAPAFRFGVGGLKSADPVFSCALELQFSPVSLD